MSGEEHGCPLCEFSSESKTGVGTHMALNHDISLREYRRKQNGTDHTCPSCGKGFASKHSMKTHYGQVHEGSIAGVEVQCNYCGSTTRTSKTHAEELENHYCDKDCHQKWQSENLTSERTPDYTVSGKDHHNYNRVEVNCAWCGKVYTVTPSEQKTTKCCSIECKHKWHSEKMSKEGNPHWVERVENECKMCGSVYKTKPSVTDSTSFCSRACQGEWTSENRSGENHPCYKGGGPWYYGPNWEAQAARARDRDQHRCQDCGMSEAEHLSEYGRKNPVHHITPIREFRSDGILDYENANSLSNLITVCDNCHAKWDQLSPLTPDTVNTVAD